MEKIDQTIDEFLDRASQNLTKLEHIHEVSSGKTHPQRSFDFRAQRNDPGCDLQTLAAGREQQIERERVRLENEIQKMAAKASYAVEKW